MYYMKIKSNSSTCSRSNSRSCFKLS